MKNKSQTNESKLLLSKKYGTILADPPWRFLNRTGKVAPEHDRLHRYQTMSFEDIMAMPISYHAQEASHLYLWVPNALLKEGLDVMQSWGFKYKSNIVWHKVRKDGGPDGRGVGFYFRNVTELILFGIRGSLRTRDAGRSQVNIIRSQKREHSRKPDEIYDIIESCSPGPYLELFARVERKGWDQWGDEIDTYPMTQLERIENGKTYKIEPILRRDEEMLVHNKNISRIQTYSPSNGLKQRVTSL
jgi:N6-adenosine-specific RNA methylase IME4